MMTKSELRRLIREQKSLISRDDLNRFSMQVCEQVLANEHWLNASTVLLYHSLPDEVDTHLLLESALKSGKQVLLPVVKGMELELRFFSHQMSEGAFGILEPEGEAFLDFSSIDLVIVPGIAFDREGHRLGRGRGYYDRLLPFIPQACTLGICFPFQLVEKVPTDSHDIAMTEVITCIP